MNQTYKIAVILSFFAPAFAYSNTPAPTTAPSTTTTVSSTPIATVTPTATPVLLTADEKKKLLSEFQKALSNQKSALAHQEKSSMKELASSQSLKQKKWREEQRKARKQYFDQHMSGPERREYVQAYLKKKEEFDASIKAEYLTAKKTWMEKSVTLRSLQKEQSIKFNEFLDKGIRPPVILWPTGN